jgi:hypothetical protein
LKLPDSDDIETDSDHPIHFQVSRRNCCSVFVKIVQIVAKVAQFLIKIA